MIKPVVLLILLWIGLYPFSLQAQTPAAGEQPIGSSITPDSIAFGEALVKLAWKTYPQNDAYRLRVKQEDETITQAKWDWLDALNASFNINEGNLNPGEVNPNLFFPRYNFRFSISVGDILSTPSQVRYARLGKEIAEENLEQQRLMIRREVLSRYFTYLYLLDLLKVKMQAFQDMTSSFTLASQSFRNGEISLDEYNKALAAKSRAQEERIEVMRDLMMAELELEELLGMELEKAREVIRVEGY